MSLGYTMTVRRKLFYVVAVICSHPRGLFRHAVPASRVQMILSLYLPASLLQRGRLGNRGGLLRRRHPESITNVSAIPSRAGAPSCGLPISTSPLLHPPLPTSSSRHAEKCAKAVEIRTFDSRKMLPPRPGPLLWKFLRHVCGQPSDCARCVSWEDVVGRDEFEDLQRGADRGRSRRAGMGDSQSRAARRLVSTRSSQ